MPLSGVIESYVLKKLKNHANQLQHISFYDKMLESN